VRCAPTLAPTALAEMAEALYEAKRQGRNRVAVADADVTPGAAAPHRAGFRG
jgi:hypothetical protein